MAKRNVRPARRARSDAPRAARAAPLMKRVAERLSESKRLQAGTIVVRLRGAGGGDFCLDCTPESVKLLSRLPRQTEPPRIEVIGDAAAIEEIIQAKADPVVHFFRGRFRVRGDLRYLSDLAMEFNLIQQPL